MRRYRKKHGLNCAAVAAMVGLAESTWRSFENGHREVDGDIAKLIELRCGIPREDIRPDLFKRRVAA